ncbi:hypothetical protein CYQ73_05855 [Enterococcus faecium]|nr:glycosyltransferase family 2 protein [Enterococcus faecium]MBD9697701.1 glycosyltransferase family 2 protein [Enterococcus faecium]PQF78621.1 hypothetical protein CUS72_02845 [Enterococcus faecium]RBS34718.1 hypothetical protein EB14_00576 [Enterococcus faecium]RXU71636.1 hypothetical protein CYQ86_08190 [Enterococcus faecium]RXW64484.1 hypothetical protein CYQ73_05855 [Enterococcus faecium]
MISIVIPFYNAENTLERCIKSILQQTYYNIEIILVDNNSNDESKRICKSISKKNTNIIYVFNKKKGVSHSRNIGIKNATGKYVMFIDADDYIEKNHCERYLKKLIEEDSDLVVGGYKIESNKEIISIMQMSEYNFKSDQKYNLVKLLLENSTLNACWNKLYKKEEIVDSFEEDNSLGEDLLFNLDYMSRINRISTISDTTYIYDVTYDNSLSRKIRFDLLESSLKILTKEMDFFNMETTDFEAQIFNDFVVLALYSQVQLLILHKKIFLSVYDVISILQSHGYSLDTILDNNTIKKSKKIRLFILLYRKNMRKSVIYFFKAIDFIKKLSIN